MTIVQLLSPGLMIMSSLFQGSNGLNHCLFRFCFLGILYCCICKSCSTDKNKDSSWKGPTGLNMDLSLNYLCLKGLPI